MFAESISQASSKQLIIARPTSSRLFPWYLITVIWNTSCRAAVTVMETCRNCSDDQNVASISQYFENISKSMDIIYLLAHHHQLDVPCYQCNTFGHLAFSVTGPPSGTPFQMCLEVQALPTKPSNSRWKHCCSWNVNYFAEHMRGVYDYIYLFIYNEIVHEYTEEYKKI